MLNDISETLNYGDQAASVRDKRTNNGGGGNGKKEGADGKTGVRLMSVSWLIVWMVCRSVGLS